MCYPKKFCFFFLIYSMCISPSFWKSVFLEFSFIDRCESSVEFITLLDVYASLLQNLWIPVLHSVAFVVAFLSSGWPSHLVKSIWYFPFPCNVGILSHSALTAMFSGLSLTSLSLTITGHWVLLTMQQWFFHFQ